MTQKLARHTNSRNHTVKFRDIVEMQRKYAQVIYVIDWALTLKFFSFA